MPKSKSKSESKPQESFLSTPPVEVVEVKREPAPQEVLSYVLERLQGREQLLVLRSEELSSGRVDVPSVYSGEAEVFVIDARQYHRSREEKRNIVVVVRPLSEKVLVHYQHKFYIFVDNKWETLE
jgi:hypothetical protein